MIYFLWTLLVLAGLQVSSPPQTIDPELQAVVTRFFETQQAEDADGYLALWSLKAARPAREQLKFIFDSGDDTFIDIQVARAAVTGDSARLRIAVTRVRTDLRAKNPDGSPRLLSTRLQLALTLAREEGAWKIVREGTPADELAAELIDTADPAARRALLESDPELVNIRLVEAIRRRADTLAQVMAYRKAQAIYELGLEVAVAIGDRKAEGQAIQNIANSLYFQRDFPAALAHYERRLTLEKEIANDEGIAGALTGIATIRYSTYEYGAALQGYREALAIQERLNDQSLISTTLISTGNVLYLQGDYEGAIADYRRAETLKRRHFDLGGAATALEGLGRVYSAQGDYAAALGAFAGVLEERRQRNDVARQALVLQSIGDIHFRLGNTEQARASFDESRKHFVALKDAASAGRVLQGTALNELVIARFAAGEKAYAESISLCTGAKDAECIARAQVGLAFALAAQQKYDDAITWYVRSLASFGGLRMEDPAARARVGLAEALYGKGEYARALEEAVTARRTAAALASDDLLWRTLVSAARAERKLGRTTEALGTARAALVAVQRMATAAVDRPGQDVPADTTAAFATTAVLQAEAGDGAAAAATAEQMRGHALRISLAANEREIARGMTDEERAEERRLATELTTLIVRHDRQKQLPKPDAAQIEKLSAAIAELTARRTAARTKLFTRLPELRTWRGLGPPASPEDLGLLVDSPGTVLLQFVVDEHDLVVLAASRAEPAAAVETLAHVVTIERQELAERIARALDGGALAAVESWRQSSAELFQLLPATIVERLASAKSIIIVPDDVLWRVPFEAVPVQSRFLADRASVSYAASVTAAVRTVSPAITSPKTPIVILHSPELPPQLVSTLKVTAPAWTLRGDTAAEAERVSPASAAAAPVVLNGPLATKQRLREAIRSLPPDGAEHLPAALHIAAPFRINSAGPLFSPLLLAAAGEEEPTRGEPELEVRELFNLEPMAALVMFSDPAALSRRDGAASVAPVDWAWRANGAGTVIFRRWGGNDPAANEIIGRFYDSLRAGRSPVDALDRARTAVRNTEEGRAPAAWAGWLIMRGR